MTKTDLSQVYCLRIEIELLQKQIDGLPQNISNTVDSVKGSSPCFPYVEHTIKIEGVDMVGYENKARALEKKLEARKTELIQKADEINDFIVYWLPVMNKHKQCFVHFRINDNIDGSSVLSTQPVAETSIRVFMEFSGSDTISSQPNLPEQNLTTFIRKGFTLVEWGGAEIGSSNME
jgi:hypothetical protein